jgi:hypothetical protein
MSCKGGFETRPFLCALKFERTDVIIISAFFCEANKEKTMCYMLYLGSDIPLPVTKFDPENTVFFLSDTDDKIAFVKKHFTRKHLYYAGSNTHCGCGFFYNSYDTSDTYKINKESVVALVETIRQALKNSEQVELLVSWAGNEGQKPKKLSIMKPEQLIADEFPLDEFDFVVFIKN